MCLVEEQQGAMHRILVPLNVASDLSQQRLQLGVVAVVSEHTFRHGREFTVVSPELMRWNDVLRPECKIPDGLI